MRQCLTCGTIKAVEEFPHKRGPSRNCRRCRQANATKAWRENNRERARANKRLSAARCAERYNAARRAKLAADPELLRRKRELDRQYRAEHGEEKKALAAAWREANRDRWLATARAWAAAHPQRVAEYARQRRFRLAAATVGVVDFAFVCVRNGWRCGLCGGPVIRALKYPDPWCATLDHVVPLARGGGHTMANAQLAHLRCNISKGPR